MSRTTLDDSTRIKLDLTRLVLRSGPKVKIGSKMVPMIFTGHIMKVYGEIGPTFFLKFQSVIIQIQSLIGK